MRDTSRDVSFVTIQSRYFRYMTNGKRKGSGSMVAVCMVKLYRCICVYVDLEFVRRSPMCAGLTYSLVYTPNADICSRRQFWTCLHQGVHQDEDRVTFLISLQMSSRACSLKCMLICDYWYYLWYVCRDIPHCSSSWILSLVGCRYPV